MLLRSPALPSLAVSFHGGGGAGEQSPVGRGLPFILLTLPLTRLCLPHQKISHQIWGWGSGEAGSRWRGRGEAAQAEGRLSLGLKAGTHSCWIYRASSLPNSSSLILSLPLCSSNSFLFYLPTTSRSVFPQPQTVPLSIPSPFPTFRSLLNQTLPDITTTKAERWAFLFAPCHRTLSIFYISSYTWSRKHAS